MHIGFKSERKRNPNLVYMESNMDKRICPNCGEPCEKEYETAFVHGQELCVCCNSNIEPCCEEDGFTDNILNDGGENNNVFVDFFYETGFLKSN